MRRRPSSATVISQGPLLLACYETWFCELFGEDAWSRTGRLTAKFVSSRQDWRGGDARTHRRRASRTARNIRTARHLRRPFARGWKRRDRLAVSARAPSPAAGEGWGEGLSASGYSPCGKSPTRIASSMRSTSPASGRGEATRRASRHPGRFLRLVRTSWPRTPPSSPARVQLADLQQLRHLRDVGHSSRTSPAARTTARSVRAAGCATAQSLNLSHISPLLHRIVAAAADQIVDPPRQSRPSFSGHDHLRAPLCSAASSAISGCGLRRRQVQQPRDLGIGIAPPPRNASAAARRPAARAPRRIAR